MTLESATLAELAACCGGEVRTGPFGSQLHKRDYVDDPTATPVVMPKDMIDGRVDTTSIARIDGEAVDRLSQHILTPGDIVLARRGDIGRRAWVGEREAGWLCGTGSMRLSLRDCPRVRARYLYYYLATERAIGWLEGHSVGATMSNLSAGVVEELPVEFPTLDAQDEIVAVLDTVAALVENNRRRNEVLEETARLLYHEWFVRLRFPGHRDVSLVDSELDPMPENWRVMRLGELADVEKGLSYKGAHLGSVGAPMASLKCFAPGGGFRRDGVKMYDGPFKDRHSVEAGEIVVANTDLTQAGNVIGSAAQLPVAIFRSGGLLSHHLFRVRPKNAAPIASGYLLSALQDNRFRQWARGHASGTTVLGLRREDVERYPCVVPSSEVVQKFEELIEPVRRQAGLLDDQSQVLLNARNLLLPRLMAGELHVSDLGLDLEPVA